MSSPTPPTRRRHFEGARVSDRSRRSTPSARRSGTVRFDAYFKLSLWDERSMAWQEKPKSYETRAACRAAAPTTVAFRVVEVSPGSRTVVEEHQPA